MKYYITTFPGIEIIAKDEIETKWSGIKVGKIKKARNNSLVFFDFKGNSKELIKIGTAEDLYIPICNLKLTGTKKDLKDLQQAVKLAKDVELALAEHRKLKAVNTSKRTTFRVVAQATGDRYGYRRIDAQKAVERGIDERYNRKWKLVDDEAVIEFWLHLINKEVVIGVRLSDKTMRHRSYKLEHLPASLRPTIAWALVWISGISEHDVFLDPMCGAGTILIERAQAGPYKQLLGGDIRPEAITVAKKNIGKKYKPISVKVWDARKLPLKNNSVDKVVCNLPFGRQIGSHQENQELYFAVTKELIRVLKPKGKAVLLTSEWKLMNNVISQNKNLKLLKSYKLVEVLGCQADIFVLQNEPNEIRTDSLTKFR